MLAARCIKWHARGCCKQTIRIRTFLFRRPHKIFATCPACPVIISVALAAALAHWWLVDSALRTGSQNLVAHTDHTAMDGAGDAVEHLHVKLPCATHPEYDIIKSQGLGTQLFQRKTCSKKQKRSDLKWLCGSLEFYLNSSFFSTFPEGSFFFLQCPTLLVLLLVSQRFCWFLQIYFCFRQILALSTALIKFPVVFCIDTFHFFVSVNAFKGNRRQGAAEPKLIGWRMRAVDNDALPVWIPTFLVGTFLTPGKYFARPCFDTLYAYWTSTWRYLKQLSPLLVHMRLLFSLSLLWDTSLGI